MRYTGDMNKEIMRRPIRNYAIIRCVSTRTF